MHGCEEPEAFDNVIFVSVFGDLNIMSTTNQNEIASSVGKGLSSNEVNVKKAGRLTKNKKWL